MKFGQFDDEKTIHCGIFKRRQSQCMFANIFLNIFGKKVLWERKKEFMYIIIYVAKVNEWMDTNVIRETKLVKKVAERSSESCEKKVKWCKQYHIIIYYMSQHKKILWCRWSWRGKYDLHTQQKRRLYGR